jgi:uncharacterized membrane protein
MAHHHGPVDAEAWSTPARTRLLLRIAIGTCAIATLVGLFLLWPRGLAPAATNNALGFAPLVAATVESARLEPCSYSSADQVYICNDVEARVTKGKLKGTEVPLELSLGAGIVTLHTGDRIVLSYEADAPEGAQYQFADFQRGRPMVLLLVIFAAVVIALGRLRGVMALAGLALSLVVLIVFLLPSLLRGHDPLAVALVGASVVAFLALYLAHGVNERTTVALLGSFAALGLTGVLSLIFVGAAHFTGLSQEEAGFLQLTAGQVNLQGLLLAGIIIGSLGVLDDVTVTQVSSVWELHQADAGLTRADLYRAGVRIGRDHIASTVNTLVLAYAGAALPLLLLFTEANRGLSSVVTSETVAVEVVRTLVGSIGLVASVPITTALAVVVISPHDTTRVRRPRRPRPLPAPAPDEPERPPPSWDDFAPGDTPQL